MKSCAVCGRTFPDEYSFCLTDGTPLDGVGTLAEEPTIVRERPLATKRTGRSILIFVLAVLLSLSLGATAAVLYFFWPRQSQNDSPQMANATATPVATTTASPRPERTLTPAPSPTERAKASVNVPAPPPPPATSDPGTTRITFGSGRAQESISSSVVEERSFVLSARAGQGLSAYVTSPDDCVNFATGDQTLRYPTITGDNRLTVINSCDGQSQFTLTVSIR